MVDLIQIATELYDEVPAKFTAARNTRAKAIASGGDRSLADSVGRLPKPSASAWALNHLATTDTKTVDEFGVLGAKLRAAQRQANRADLERLIKQRKSVVSRAIVSIQDFCREKGVQLSSSALSEIEQSLQAALADERGATAVFSRRLIKPVRSDGLDPVDLSGALAGPALRARKSELSSADRTAAAPVKPVAPKPLPALVARTRRAAEKADATVELLLKERSALDGEHDALEHDVKALQQQFDELEKRRVDLGVREAQLDSATRSAIVASRDAHRAADKAQTSR